MKAKVLVSVWGLFLVLVLIGLGLVFSAGAVVPLASGQATGGSFQGLGDLPGGTFFSHAWDMSMDGTTVTGSSDSGYGQAFHWTQAGSMVGLPPLPGDPGCCSDGDGLSRDGLIVAGYSGSEACRWTIDSSSGGWVAEGLGDLIGGSFSSKAYAMSYDGQVVVGEGSSSKGTEAFRWTANDGMVGLGDLPGGRFFSQAMGCSENGSVVVGQGNVKNGGAAFRWTASKGMVNLGVLPKRKFSAAWACSGDGSVVVGQSWGGGQQTAWEEAFRWTAATGMKGLGDLPGGIAYSEADGVSPDGSIVVGGSASADGIEAFIWDANKGMRRVADYLAASSVEVPAGWTLRYANSITVNSETRVVTISGVGINPEGNTEAWIAAVMPDPY